MDDKQNKSEGAQSPDQFEEQLAELIKKTGGVVPQKRKPQETQESDFSSSENNSDAPPAQTKVKTPEEIDAEIEALINNMGVKDSAPDNAFGAGTGSENNEFSQTANAQPINAQDAVISNGENVIITDAPPVFYAGGGFKEGESAQEAEMAANAQAYQEQAFDGEGADVFNAGQPQSAAVETGAAEKSLEEIEAEIAALEQAVSAENAAVQPQEVPVEPNAPDFSIDGQNEAAELKDEADITGGAAGGGQSANPDVTVTDEDLLNAELEALLSQLEAEDGLTNGQTAAPQSNDFNQTEQTAEVNGEHIEIVPTPETYTVPSEPVDVGEFAKVIDKLADALGSDSSQTAEQSGQRSVPPITEQAQPESAQADYAAMEAQLQALLAEEEPKRQSGGGQGGDKELTSELDSLRAQIASLESLLKQKEQQPAAAAAQPETPPVPPSPTTAAAASGDVNAMFKQWFDLEMAAKMKNIISEDEKNRVKSAAAAFEAKEGTAEAEAAPFDSDFVKLGEDVYYNVKEKKAYVLKPVAPVSNLPAVMPQPRPVKKTVKKPVRRPAAKAAPARRKRRPAGLARPRRPRRPFPRRPRG